MKRQKTGDNVWMLHPVDTVDPQTAPTHKQHLHTDTVHTDTPHTHSPGWALAPHEAGPYDND